MARPLSQGYACPNPSCGIRLHPFCATRRLGANGQCPDHFSNPPDPCNQCVAPLPSLSLRSASCPDRATKPCRVWPRDPKTRKFAGVPVGVAALGLDDEDEADESVRATSEAGSPGPGAASAMKKNGKSKGKAAAKKGKKRGRPAGEEDEDEDDELVDDDDDGERPFPALAAVSLRACH